LQLSWDSKKHPRGKAGSGSGGQFAPLGYDSSRKTGTGYAKAKGDDRVRQAQAALRKQGLTDARGNPLKLDGKLGPRTTESIKAYQRKHGLRPDGKITPALLKQLKSGNAPSPGRHKKTSLTSKKPVTVSKRPSTRGRNDRTPQE
jgi:peptidoglycan hydrolase-like protein with peptidoglycan-binding domain